MKELWKSANVCQNYERIILLVFFKTHTVYSNDWLNDFYWFIFYLCKMTACSHAGDNIEHQIVKKTTKVVEQSASLAGFL